MTPVDQTKFHTETTRGNCFAAAIASLLDLPLGDIPAFEEAGAEWHEPFLAWCHERRLEPVFLASMEPPKGYSIVSGLSPRGNNVMHSAIALDGTLVFDPHPSRAGLVWVRDYLIFEPVE